MMPIQNATYDLIQSGKSVIARDFTGSGKTLAFTLPMIEKIRTSEDGFTGKTKILVMTPTRELCR